MNFCAFIRLRIWKDLNASSDGLTDFWKFQEILTSAPTVRILFPYYNYPNHFAAGEINKLAATVRYGDSLQWHALKDLTDNLLEFLALCFHNVAFTVSEDLPCGDQKSAKDSTSCTLTAVNTLLHHALGVPLWTGPE
jgi:hypothetical protein